MSKTLRIGGNIVGRSVNSKQSILQLSHSSRADCRNIKNNMSRFKRLYLCIWTLIGILLIGASVQLGILYNFLRYELQRNGLAKLILHEPIAEI